MGYICECLRKPSKSLLLIAFASSPQRRERLANPAKEKNKKDHRAQI
jgi:hypothetical protein